MYIKTDMNNEKPSDVMPKDVCK